MLLPLMTLPLLMGGVCIITSIIGTYFVRLGSGKNVMGAMYKGFLVTAVLSIPAIRSEEHTSELQSLMRISYAVFCLNKKITTPQTPKTPKNIYYNTI